MPPEESNKTRIGAPAPKSDPPASPASPDPGPDAGAAGAPPQEDLPPNTPAAGGGADTPPDPLVGTTLLDRYYIERKLGEGGMGSVYLAQHVTLEKHVALKVLHGEFSRKEDLVERFLQEARAASRIRHENVIDITDFGTTPQGMVFFAMELLEGHDLHEDLTRVRLEGRAIPWERSRDIFLQVCAALSAAHGQGIIHRDLKPENIYLVEWGGQPDFVKLLDFGIAKLTEVNEEGRKLTRTGMLFGTPEYMSPEQARGEKVDHRVDVYAMGCILYQLLTGRVPYEADNFMGILSMHLTDPVPQIDPQALDLVGAPRELAPIIEKALAKEPDERFASIDDLVNAILAIEQGVAPEQVAPPPRRRRTQWTGSVKLPDDEADEPVPPPRKGRGGSIVGAVALLGVAGAIAAVVLTRGGGSEQAATSADAGAEAAAVPDRVTLELTSEPSGARIIDTETGQQLGQTPLTYDMPGDTDPRTLRFELDGHQSKLLELVPDEDVTYDMTLPALEGGAEPAEPAVEVADQSERPSRDTRPDRDEPKPERADTTPERADTRPERPEPADTKPEPTETATSDTKPDQPEEPATDTSSEDDGDLGEVEIKDPFGNE